MSKEPEYVFLLGAGRSGTKFLRDILGYSTNVNIIPYDVGYVWRYGNERVPHDEFTVDMLDDKIKSYVRQTLPRLVKDGFSQDSQGIIIEKSVPNTLRPDFVREIYPKAKFIHLIRDGRAVTESSMRLWQADPERGYLLKKLKYFPWKNYKYAFWYLTNIIKGKLSSDRGQQLWGPVYEGLVEDVKTQPLEVVCARQWRKCVEVSLSQLQIFDQEQVLEVRYEDLMSDAKALARVCGFVGIKDSSKVIQAYEDKVVRTHTDKWKKSLNAEQQTLIYQEIGELNSQLGYN